MRCEKLSPQSVIVLLTGYPGFVSAVEGIQQDVDDYFVKPADYETLFQPWKSNWRQSEWLQSEWLDKLPCLVFWLPDAIMHRASDIRHTLSWIVRLELSRILVCYAQIKERVDCVDPSICD